MQSVSSLLTTQRAALVASHPLSKKRCCSKSSGVGGIRRRQRQRTPRSFVQNFVAHSTAAENEDDEDEDEEMFEIDEGEFIVEAFDTEEELSAALCLEVFENAKACIEDRGAFSLAIPGRSVAKALKGLCKLEDEGLDWSKMHVFFVNERPEEQKCYNLARTTWVDEFIAQGKFKLENLHKVMENALHC